MTFTESGVVDVDLTAAAPRRHVVLLGVVSLMLLATVLVVVRIPSAVDLVVMGSDATRLRVVGLGVPHGEPGATVTARTTVGEVVGTVVAIDPDPSSEAVAVMIELDDAWDRQPEQYSPVLVDFGDRSMLQMLREAW